ncbi:MAG: DoxX family protein [Opitutales bacterium]|nr:DoxX family protein [Opitutales bacterium]
MKKSMMCSLAAFSDDFGKLFLRIVLAFAIIPHGAQKVFGVFGGNGLQATWQYFTEVLQISPLWAGTAICVEFLAPIFLILGIFTRLWAILLAVLMAVAMQYHFDNGYFLNWTGNQLGEGIEFHLLYIGAAIALVLLGGGKFAFLRLCKCSDCSCKAETPSADESATEK